MKGLLYKDLLLIRRQAKFLLLMLAVYAFTFILAARGGDPVSSAGAAGIVTAFAVMLETVLVINTMAYDESAKWDGYARTLPVGPGGVVGAKYLFVLLFSAAMAALAVLAEAALLRGRITGEDAAGAAAGAGLSPLVLCSVLLPFVYRFGLQKARFVMAAIFLIPWALTSLLKNFSSGVPWETVVRFLPLAAALLFAGSYFLSRRLYSRRDAG